MDKSGSPVGGKLEADHEMTAASRLRKSQVQIAQRKQDFDLEHAIGNYLRTNNEESLARLAEAGRGLVYHFASLYTPVHPSEDAVQAGYEGLLKAAQRF